MDLLTRAILESVGDAGFAVSYTVGEDGQHFDEAIAEDSGERLVVRGFIKKLVNRGT